MSFENYPVTEKLVQPVVPQQQKQMAHLFNCGSYHFIIRQLGVYYLAQE